MAHDVFERRRVNQTLADALATEGKAVERLHELDRTISEFVATVSHDLRTPTTSIVGCTELLQDGLAGELNYGQLSLVDSIERNTQRLITLADDLVTLARVDAGDLEMKASELDLRDVVSQARDALQPHLLDQSLEIARCPAGRFTAVCFWQRDSADLRHVLRLGSDTRVWEPRGCSLRSERAADGPASPAEDWASVALSAASCRSPLGVILGPGSHHRRRLTLTSCMHTAEIVDGLWLILRESR